MKIAKTDDYYLFSNEDGEYHLSIKDFEELGEDKATELAKAEIAKKKVVGRFKESTINFSQARELGFCDYGIKDFCETLNLDLNETYDILKMYELFDESKLDLLFRYIYEIHEMFGKDVFTKNEEAISNNAEYSYYYAKDVLRGRFEKGEEVISGSDYYSYWYAKDVLRRRFEKGEEAIFKSYYSYRYSLDVLKGQFEKGEEAISNNFEYNLYYMSQFRITV